MEFLPFSPHADCVCKQKKLLVCYSDNQIQMQEALFSCLSEIEKILGNRLDIAIFDYTELFSVSSQSRVEKFMTVRSPMQPYIRREKIIEFKKKKINGSLEIPGEINVAIKSELHSFFQDDKLPNTPLRFWLEGSLKKRYRMLSSFLHEEVGEEHFCYILLNNGRQVSSVTVSKWARGKSTKLIFWERNQGPRELWFCDHPPQDFFAYVDEFKRSLDKKPDFQQVSKWLHGNKYSTIQNPFSEKWVSLQANRQLEKISQSGTPSLRSGVAIFATSSDDEFESLGDIFPKKNWQNQFNGFDAFLQSSKEKFLPLIRFHPNFYNKSSKFLMRRYKEAAKFLWKYPETTIVYPRDNINTYKLLEEADLLVTGNSTLGVEAAAQGQRVRHINHSAFPFTSDLTNQSPLLLNEKFDKDLREIAIREIAVKLAHIRLVYNGPMPEVSWGTLHSIFGYKRGWTLWRMMSTKLHRVLYHPITGIFKIVVLFIHVSQKFRKLFRR